MLVVELGFKLNYNLEYYENILKESGLKNDFNCVTYDIYYANCSLNGLTENEMKQKCIRLRNVNFKDRYKIENNLLKDLGCVEVKECELIDFENRLAEFGYSRLFDTKKTDHHFCKEGMNSKVQLQEIEGVGLLVYYDNSLYYDLDINTQRKKLIDELNSFGFNFKYTDLGLDKLRTLYYQKEKYSENQNG